MPWQETLVKTSYSSGTLKHSGGGDNDIFSKSGRNTRVELSTSNIRPDDQWKNILVDVFYSVKEMHKNNTFLTWTGTASLPVTVDTTKHSIVIKDTRNYSGSWLVRGEVHDPLSLNDSGNTVIVRGTYRIDAKGDDLNNAGFELDLAVLIMYNDK